MSQDLGLESRREAPPLFGPLLSPFLLPVGSRRSPDAASEAPIPLRAGGGVRVPGRRRGSSLGASHLSRVQPGPRPSRCGVSEAGAGGAGEKPEGAEGEAGAGGGAALLQEFPGIKLRSWRWVRRVDATGSSSPQASRRRPATLTPVAGPPRAPGPLCDGRAASSSGGRRGSAAPGHRRHGPAPRYRGFCAGPAPTRRASPRPSGGGGTAPAPSDLRDAPGPGDRGLAPAAGDRVLAVARSGRRVPEAAGSRRLAVAPSDRRDASVAGDRRVSADAGRRGESGLPTLPGRLARPRRRAR